MEAEKDFLPFDPKKPFIPRYYFPVDTNHSGPFDVISICQAYDLKFEVGCAVKYLLRAGRKPGAPEAKDLTKAMEFIQRRLNSL